MNNNAVDNNSKMLKILKDSKVTDPAVINAMLNFPRTLFIEKSLHNFAYDDVTMPIGRGQTISMPSVVARMTQALELSGTEKVLEIGTGCGYQTAILSVLCDFVYTIERHPTLSSFAKNRFELLGIKNVLSCAGDGGLGLSEYAPFDRIIATCAAEDVPPTLFNQLKEGGIMVIPVGFEDDNQELLCVRKNNSKMDVEQLGPVNFVPMLPGVGI